MIKQLNCYFKNYLRKFLDFSILKSAVLYGANAGGKSNLFAAMRCMKNLMINSSKESQANEYLEVESFKLNTDTENMCVFDKDSFTDIQFNHQLCKVKKIRLAYTNKAFELWYLLHFDYIDTALPRDQYGDKLSKRIGQEYRKENPLIYTLL